MVPRVRSALRLALEDFFFNSWRLVPANALWGVAFVAVVLLAFAASLLALVMLVLLALPTVGIFRMSALLARGEPVTFSDGLAAWRELLGPALAAGTLIAGLTVVLGFNTVAALGSLSPLGWAFGTLAAWGLVALSVVALLFWPLLADPVRAGDPVLSRLRLALMLILVHPLRVAQLALLSAVVVIVSTIMLAALLTVSVAFVAIVASRVVLPLADQLEQRATSPVIPDG